MRTHAAVFLSVILPLAAAAADEPQRFPQPPASIELEDGDTLVFLGDSITHQCLYTQYVEDYFYTRHPQARINFHNAGVGGDRAIDALVRFDADVAAFKPKYVTILLGMNDGGYTRFEQEIFDRYEADMTTLLDRIADLGARAIPITPTMFDSRAARIRDRSRQGGGRPRPLRNTYYNGVLAFYGAWLREQAQTRGLGFVDMHSPLNDITFQQRKSDPDFTLIADAVHPGPAGQAVMAMAVLDDLRAGRSVSAIQAVRRGGKWQVTARGGEVAEVADGEQLAFKFRADCLPWVLPEEAQLGYELTRAGHRMSNERLRISGLAPGRYELRIDGQPVGRYTHSQLEFKIELQANADTPQHQQALQVAMLNKQRNDEAMRPLRGLWSQMKRRRRELSQIAENDPQAPAKRQAFADWEAEFRGQTEKLLAECRRFENRIYEINQPPLRSYSLSKVAAAKAPPAKAPPAKAPPAAKSPAR